MSSKSVLQERLVKLSSKVSYKSVKSEVSSKIVLQDCQVGAGCQVRVSSKKCQVRVSSKKCLTRVSSKSVVQECQVRVSHTSVKQECQVRVSSKSVLPERCAIVSSKGVLQECHLSVSTQGVSQVGSLENVRNKYCLCSSTYVSAFEFVGFILFFSPSPSHIIICILYAARMYVCNIPVWSCLCVNLHPTQKLKCPETISVRLGTDILEEVAWAKH